LRPALSTTSQDSISHSEGDHQPQEKNNKFTKTQEKIEEKKNEKEKKNERKEEKKKEMKAPTIRGNPVITFFFTSCHWLDGGLELGRCRFGRCYPLWATRLGKILWEEGRKGNRKTKKCRNLRKAERKKKMRRSYQRNPPTLTRSFPLPSRPLPCLPHPMSITGNFALS